MILQAGVVPNRIADIVPPRNVPVWLRLQSGTEVLGMRTGDAGRIAYEYHNPPAGIDDFRPTHWRRLDTP